MGSLPEKRNEKGGYLASLHSPNPWTGSIDEIESSLADGPMKAQEVYAEIAALKAAGVGYWPDLSEAEERAALVVWVEALSKIPAPFVRSSFKAWRETMPRRPAPGDIANAARERVRACRDRLKAELPKPEPDGPFRPSSTPLSERAAIAERMQREYADVLNGSRLKRPTLGPEERRKWG